MSDEIISRLETAPPPTEPSPADLYLMGAGISFPDHLSLQTLEVMRICNRIYSNLPKSELDILPETVRSKCVSLYPLYQDNRDRTANYVDVAETVVEAIPNQRPVGWLTPGHPLVFDSVSQTLLRSAAAHAWSVCVVPALSCIDTVLAQLGYDPADGLLIFEATALVVRSVSLNTNFAVLLLQPSAFGSDLAHYSSLWRPDLAPLRDHLSRYYPWDQPCAFVRSSSWLSGSPHVSWHTLGELAAAPFEIVAGSTLFIPAA